MDATDNAEQAVNVALANAFTIFSIEEDENYIRLSTFGQQVACWPAGLPQGVALLKLEAERRAALTLPVDVNGLVEEWRKAMEGVTPGPWHTEPMETSQTDSLDRLYVAGPSEIVHPHDGVCEPERFNDRSFKEDAANMRFIARCSPDNIGSLLAALTAQSSLLDELLSAAKTVMAGLDARIDKASANGGTAVPVFDGIAALHDAIGAASRLHHQMAEE